MVTFRNNTRRNNFRRNERTFKVNSDRNKFNNAFSNNDAFQRKISGRNNHNASKLIEKYNNLAREALSTGDKILSENYFMANVMPRYNFLKDKFEEDVNTSYAYKFGKLFKF